VQKDELPLFFIFPSFFVVWDVVVVVVAVEVVVFDEVIVVVLDDVVVGAGVVAQLT